MASGKLRQKCEKGCRLELNGWDCHEPGERKRRCSHRFHEPAHLGDRAAALLLLLTHIDLDIKVRRLSGLCCCLDESSEKRTSIEGLDRSSLLAAHVKAAAKAGQAPNL